MFRSVIGNDSGDGDAYAGLGEAALALGNFRTAKADFAQAAARRPDDAALRDRMALVDTILALDPGASDLSVDERYERNRQLLVRTVDALSRCGQPSQVDTAPARELLDRRPSPATHRATGDAMAAAAINLWNARPARCDAADTDEALRAILGHLGG
jgi:hypothetical protein